MKKRNGFSLFVVLGSVLILSLLSLFLIQLHFHHEKSKLEWQNFDQAILNTENGFNYFALNKNTSSWGTNHNFEFEEGNGFTLIPVPFGVFWLVKVTGYCGNQSVSTVSIIGNQSSPDYILELNHPLNELYVGKRTKLERSILLSNETFSTWNEEHPLADLIEYGELPQVSCQSIQDQFLAPFEETWQEAMKRVFSEVSIEKRRGHLNLSNLKTLKSAKTPIIILADKLNLSGELNLDVPLILICEESVSTASNIVADRLWVFAKKSISIGRGMVGDQIHLCSNSVEVLGSIDVTRSSCVSISEDSTIPAQTSLKGRGQYQGLLASISSNKQSSVYVDPFINTEGYIYSEGEVAVQGRHDGQIRGENWHYYGEINARGKLEGVFLTSEHSYAAPWGLGNNGLRTIDRWEVPNEE